MDGISLKVAFGKISASSRLSSAQKYRSVEVGMMNPFAVIDDKAAFKFPLCVGLSLMSALCQARIIASKSFGSLGIKTPSRNFEKKDFKPRKKSSAREEEPNKRRKTSNSEKAFEKKDSKPPKKARPNETTAERRKRKPKWSAAKKKAAKIKKSKEAKENRSGRPKRRK